MKKLIILLAIVWFAIPAQAQLTIKGGLACKKDAPTQTVITGQYHVGYGVISSDLYIPHCKNEGNSFSGRAGFYLGGDWLNFVIDIVGLYEHKEFRGGYGIEVNFQFLRPIGIFARWAQTHPVYNQNGCTAVWWNDRTQEMIFGVLISI